MIPRQQTSRHNPSAGEFGDCHRACIASILELDLGDVPHFFDDGVESEFAQREHHFFKSRGLVPITIYYDGKLQDVLNATRGMNPGLYFILGGTSKNACNHSVVACDGEIVHDPSIDGSGIVGPLDNGYYGVTYFGAAIALKAGA